MQPRFTQIKSAILDSIERNRMRPGDKVASENQLAAQFDVSRMTARRALTELVDEGILLRSQGLGTFVSDHRPMSSMLSIRSINEEITQRGHHYHCDVISKANEPGSEQACTWLGVTNGTRLFHTVIVHFENQHPLQLESRWVNPEFATEYLQQDFTKITANQYLSTIAPLTQADHIVEAIMPDTDTSALLSIPPQQPCLKVSRRTFSAKGIVSYAILTHPGNRYRLGGHLDF